jgi:hypothetical protein
MLSAAAHADCLKVDDENTPIGTVSGRVTDHHKVPRGDVRAAKGIFLVLDRPLEADLGSGCENYWKIVVSTTEEDTKRTKRLLVAGKRVKMTGKLSRFGSALVDPPIFIENYEIE